MKTLASISEEKIAKHVYTIRNRRVILDLDLATLIDVPAINIKRAVKRNMNSFPPDFMFSLNKTELENLKRQINTSSVGGMKYAPMAFTYEGIEKLSSVLEEERNQP